MLFQFLWKQQFEDTFPVQQYAVRENDSCYCLYLPLDRAHSSLDEDLERLLQLPEENMTLLDPTKGSTRLSFPTKEPFSYVS